MMYERRRGAGAIEDFDRARFGGPTRVAESQVTTGLTADRIVGPNPDRVMLILTNNGPDDLSWGLSAGFAVNTRNLLAHGQTLVLQVQNDGALTGATLYGVTAINPSALNIVELIRAHADR